MRKKSIWNARKSKRDTHYLMLKLMIERVNGKKEEDKKTMN
jgi:hypothetical protein